LQVFQGEADGVFAITPMLNYILASAGFFMLLLWATANGMFHDIERPKDRMLQNEQFLDDQW
ncbi:MAG: cbb3-type cytochrome oxidase assembly protein, partial [Planctomycetales bacterium]|nr:cbb3-type cytochrome oxidase assembly protein [Planctomycetales bacterium]